MNNAPMMCAYHSEAWGTVHEDGSVTYDCGCKVAGPVPEETASGALWLVRYAQVSRRIPPLYAMARSPSGQGFTSNPASAAVFRSRKEAEKFAYETNMDLNGGDGATWAKWGSRLVGHGVVVKFAEVAEA